MLCPVCDSEEMLVLEFELVEVDYCPACCGVWLDSGELALVGERAGALCGQLEAALFEQKGRAPRDGSKRPCPVCRRKMLEVAAGSTPPVVLDRCGGGHGLWFDRGELSAVVAAAGGDQNNLLARFFAGLGHGEGPQDNS